MIDFCKSTGLYGTFTVSQPVSGYNEFVRVYEHDNSAKILK